MVPRVGAVHLGKDVVAVAACAGAGPAEPVSVDGDPTPPAAMYADATGSLHTGRPTGGGLGVAIADVREIVGYDQVVIAGVTWPTDAVVRARLHHPIEAIASHFGAPADVVALPYPDTWDEHAVQRFVDLVGRGGVDAEPVPESVAVAGYLKAFGDGTDATVLYGDGTSLLVVAVSADDTAPTQSIDVEFPLEALREPGVADTIVLAALAAARTIGADTRTVVLAGNVVYQNTFRLAFVNQLGRRGHIAEHPVHAVALGAASLVAGELGNGRGFAAVSPADESPTVVHARSDGPTEVIRRPVAPNRRAFPRRVWLTGAAVVFVVLVAVFLVVRSADEEPEPTADSIAAQVRHAVLADDAFPDMTGDDANVSSEVISMACGSVPPTDAEAAYGRAVADRRFVGGDGDALDLRALYLDASTDVLHDVVEQIQVCPNTATNDVRYVVPVPTTGGDPGPPRQEGSRNPTAEPSLDTDGAQRVAWRGLLARSASPIDAVQNVTCLLELSGAVALRACGISLDSRTADDLAEDGLSAMLREQE